MTLSQWGNLNTKVWEEGFNSCNQLTITATDAPDLVGNGVTSLASMFRSAADTSCDFSNWDVSQIVNFSYFTYNSHISNTSLNDWNVSSGEDFSSMFEQCGSFNQDIGDWNVSSGTAFDYMFRYATDFNGNISLWDVSSGLRFNSMFDNAQAFNQDIGGWDVSNSTTFSAMFSSATIFNQDLSAWTPTKALSLSGFYYGTGMTVNNYDLLLNAWSLLTFDNTDISFGFGQNYTIATSQAARDVLTNAPNNWNISDSGGI